MKIERDEPNDLPTASTDVRVDTKENRLESRPTAAEIQDWLVLYTAKLLGIEPTAVEVLAPLQSYLDSMTLVAVSGDLSDWLGRDVDPSVLGDSRTIEAIAKHL